MHSEKANDEQSCLFILLFNPSPINTFDSCSPVLFSCLATTSTMLTRARHLVYCSDCDAACFFLQRRLLCCLERARCGCRGRDSLIGQKLQRLGRSTLCSLDGLNVRVVLELEIVQSWLMSEPARLNWRIDGSNEMMMDWPVICYYCFVRLLTPCFFCCSLFDDWSRRELNGSMSQDGQRVI